MPTIRQRKGSFRAEICVNKIRESATFDTKAEAMMWALKREEEIRSGRVATVAPRTTVGKLLSDYAKKVSPTKKGARWEILRINAILKTDFSEIPLRDFTPDHAKDYVKDRLRVVSGSSVNREINLLSHCFTTAIEWGWLTENPFHNIKRPKSSRPRDRIATDDEINRICSAMGITDDKPKNTIQRVALAVHFAIETGMRAGEIASIKPAAVAGSVVTLLDTKNGDKRRVPLSAKAREILTLVDNDFTLTGAQIDSLWRKYRDRAGVDGLRFHDLRHLAVTRLSKKLDILALARMIGHRNIRMLQVYYNESAESIAERL